MGGNGWAPQVKSQQKEKYHVIHIVAMAFLSPEETSAESERTFSSAGRLVDSLRASMLAWKVEAYMFLHRNTAFIKGIKDMPKPKKTT